MRSANRLLLVHLCLLMLISTAPAAELGRRSLLGIALSPIPESLRAQDPRFRDEGIRVDRVFPHSSAAQAGLVAGDILLKVDSKALRSTADIAPIIRAKRVGEKLKLSLVRNGESIEQDVSLVGLPYETAGDYDTLYEAVDADGVLRRTILTRPREKGPYPAVLFVGGIGRYSMDYPLDEKATYRQFLASLTRQGFMTMRVEKTGMGDSEGEPCAKANLLTEIGGYVSGLKALKARADVDPGRVFIVGHSIGGIVGPLVADKVPVRGLVVMETVGSTWFEYELINRRRQLKLRGMEPHKIGLQMQLKQWCMHQLLIERRPRQQILEERPACAEEMEIPSSDTYLQQIAAVDLPGLWSRLKSDTLVIYGSADFLTSAEEHREIVDTLNAARPGAATYVEFPDMDHSFYRMKDQSESFRYRHSGNPGEFHTDLGPIVARWLKERT